MSDKVTPLTHRTRHPQMRGLFWDEVTFQRMSSDLIKRRDDAESEEEELAYNDETDDFLIYCTREQADRHLDLVMLHDHNRFELMRDEDTSGVFEKPDPNALDDYTTAPPPHRKQLRERNKELVKHNDAEDEEAFKRNLREVREPNGR